MGKSKGDTIEIPNIVKDIVSPYAQDSEFSIEQKQFDRLYSAPVQTEPRFGRFYPKGLLKAIPGIFQGNVEPFRCTGISDTTITVDFNHPLSPWNGNLTMDIKDVRRNSGILGGSCTDWMEMITQALGCRHDAGGFPQISSQMNPLVEPMKIMMQAFIKNLALLPILMIKPYQSSVIYMVKH